MDSKESFKRQTELRFQDRICEISMPPPHCCGGKMHLQKQCCSSATALSNSITHALIGCCRGIRQDPKAWYMPAMGAARLFQKCRRITTCIASDWSSGLYSSPMIPMSTLL